MIDLSDEIIKALMVFGGVMRNRIAGSDGNDERRRSNTEKAGLPALHSPARRLSREKLSLRLGSVGRVSR